MFGLRPLKSKFKPATGPTQAGGFSAKGPDLIVGSAQPNLRALEYRFEAIMRDRAQRTEPRPDGAALTAEALSIAAQLLYSGWWSRTKYREMVVPFDD